MDPKFSSSGCCFNTTLQAESNCSVPCRNTMGRRPRRPPPPCYTCNTSCIYKCVELVFFIGVIANIIVIISVASDRKLRRPTFVAIACLALSDALFSTSHMTLAVEVIVRAMTCTFVKKLTFNSDVFETLKSICWTAANLHVTLMAVVRYVMLVYPLRSHFIITNRRLLVVSALIWTVSTTVFVTKSLISESLSHTGKDTVVPTTIVWLCVYLLPLVVTSVLHIVKLRKLRASGNWLNQKSTTSGSCSQSTLSRKASVVRMARMVTLVVLLATILPLSKFVQDIVDISDVSFPTKTFRAHLRDTSILLFVLNNALNPFIYAFMSPEVRKSVKSRVRTLSRYGKFKNSRTMTNTSTRKSGSKPSVYMMQNSTEVQRRTNDVLTEDKDQNTNL